MRYLSVCSGIEAATVAWHPLGWEPAAFSEIEAFPRSVLAHHYPHVPLHGDFTTIKGDEYGATDLLVGGTPCQSFSVAGLRKGLDDPRGNLMLEYGALAKRLGARWLVWENVPGVLSSNGGRDFAAFLGMLAELGYGFAYRVLDAQYFGVAQRRRRVFVVGCLGDWRSAAAVLFERHSLSGHPAPRRQKGQDAAAGLVGGVDYEGNGHDVDAPTGPLLKGSPTGGGHPLPAIARWPAEVAPTLNAAFGSKLGLENQHIRGGQDSSFLTFDRQSSGEYGTAPVASTMSARDYKSPSDLVLTPTNGGVFVDPVALGIPGNWIGRRPENGGNAVEPMHEVSPCLTKTDRHGVAAGMAVRRLTPRECERLQGFPDDYTLVPHRGKPAADGPRYKALGNSMAVPVMAWIGQRIDQVAAIRDGERAAA